MLHTEALATITSALSHTNAAEANGQQQGLRPWGSWTVLADGAGFKVKMIELKPGHRVSLHYHHRRSEHWVVVAGKARIVIGEKRYDMHLMQSVLIPARTVHRIENPYSETLQIVEVQRGDRLDEDDIVRLEDDYERLHLAGGFGL
jgi:mannose-6-phosphate isomerase-like protein (cupin superfamily)